MKLSISVVVPTYRRPEMLVGCLRALHNQTEPPAEVLVAYRGDDAATTQALGTLLESERRFVRPVVLKPGQNLACGLRAGIDASQGDLVALTDDDAEPAEDWLAQLRARFDQPEIVGVGGRDLLSPPPTSAAAVVGRCQWFGRTIGGHHAGCGSPRDVDILKGVNCCFRGDTLRGLGVDPRLRGEGTVMNWEIALCLPLRRAGYRLVYDPAITVTHHAAPRNDGDDNHRGGFNAAALRNLVHNETFLVLDHLPPIGLVAFAAWSVLIGTRFAPGLLQLVRLVLSGRRRSLARWWATLQGRGAGFITWLYGGRRTVPLAKRSALDVAAP